MMHTRVDSTQAKNGLLVIMHKPLKGVTQSNEVAASFGIDANPYPGIKGIFARATSAGRGVIIGFINKFLATLPGEIRIYSTDSSGNAIVASMHFKNDGTIVIDGDIFITGDVDITGDLDVAGDITVTGGDVVADGISLKNHTHNYFDDGNPNVTGPANP